jgi:hypothetical protein
MAHHLPLLRAPLGFFSALGFASALGLASSFGFSSFAFFSFCMQMAACAFDTHNSRRTLALYVVYASTP